MAENYYTEIWRQTILEGFNDTSIILFAIYKYFLPNQYNMKTI